MQVRGEEKRYERTGKREKRLRRAGVAGEDGGGGGRGGGHSLLLCSGDVC